MTERVVIITDKRHGHVLKVFDRDDDGWDRAQEWVDEWDWPQQTRTTSVEIH